MTKRVLCAGLVLALSGCHFLAAPAVVAIGTGLGIASSVEALAKDVLEIDTSYHALLGAPAAPSPAAVQ